ncbi:MAG: GldG family protein [Spirochaetales bacterium]|nr:GldG family protein [Spirochaetales bacterium]
MKKILESKWLKFTAWIIVILLVNIAATTLFFRADLTGNKIYSLSEASRTAVSELEEPLTIKIFLSENLPAPYNNMEQNISDVLEEYGLAANKFFNYSINMIGTADEDEKEESAAARTAAQSYGINPIQIQKVANDEVQLVSAFMGMVFIQGDIVETIPVLSASYNMEYQITSTITGMSEKTGALLALENDLEVRLYFSGSLANAGSNMNTYAESIRSAVEDLNRLNYGRLQFSIIDPENLKAGDLPPSEYNLPSVKLQNGRGGVSNNVYASLIITSGEKYGTLNLLNRGVFGYQIEDAQKVKESLTGVIDKLAGVNPKIGYLADHGTPALYANPYGQQQGPSLNNLRNLIGSNYDIQQVNLAEDGIPEGIQSLIVASPASSFTEWEQFLLDQYIMKGNAVIFMLDSMNEIMPQQNQGYGQQAPVYIPRDLGLGDFLNHYGFSLGNSYILDENCFVQTSRQNNGGVAEVPIYFAPKIEGENINQDSPILNNIKGLLLLNSSPLVLSETPASGAAPVSLINSSDKAWEMKDEINLYNPMMIMPPSAEARKTMVAAAVAEGPMTSFFKGKSRPTPPEPPAEDENGTEGSAGAPVETAPEGDVLFEGEGAVSEGGIIESGEEGKIFLVGSSMLIMDNVLDASGNTPNATFILNLVDSFNGREDFARMRSKGQTYNPLEETSSGVKNFIKGFNMAGLPILTAVLGLLIMIRRIGRKRQIEAMFKKEGE